jgi:nicotinamide-nucleotide amidase
MIPESGIVIHNSTGTAQGFLVSTSQSSIICLPGVPAEMTLMFEDWVIPYILRESDDRREKCTRVINTFGMSESILDEKTREIIQPDEHLSYSTLVNDGIVSIRITVSDVEEKKQSLYLMRLKKIFAWSWENLFLAKAKILLKILFQNF